MWKQIAQHLACNKSSFSVRVCLFFFFNYPAPPAILLLPNYILLKLYWVNQYNKKKLKIEMNVIATQENARANQDTSDFHLLFVRGPFSTCPIGNEKLIILFFSGLQPFLSGI